MINVKKYLSVATLLSLAFGMNLYADVVPQVHRDLHRELQKQIDVMSYFTSMEDSVEMLQGVEPWEPYAPLDIYGEMNDDFKPVIDFNKTPLQDYYDIRMYGWVAPIKGRINSPYGKRHRRMHKGTDIKVFTGDTIRAAFDGYVRVRKFQRRGYGYYYVIRHDNGLETIYGHLSKQIVNQGVYVKAGQAIGLGGSTGRSTGPHLHFEMRLLGIPLDPAALIDFDTFEPRDTVFKVNRRQAELAASGSIQARGKVLSGNYTYDNGTNSHAWDNQAPNNQRSNTNQKNNKQQNQSQAKPNKGNSNNGMTYTIRRGDTLESIARRHGTTVKKLCDINGIRTSKVLQVGHKIRVR